MTQKAKVIKGTLLRIVQHTKFKELLDWDAVRKNWHLALSSVILAFCLGAGIYFLTFRNLAYSSFTAQSSTWLGMGKEGDFALLWSLTLFTFPIYLVVKRLSVNITKTLGPEYEKGFADSIKFSLVPLAFWTIISVVSKDLTFVLPIFSVALIIWTLILGASVLIFKKRGKASPTQGFLHAWYIQIATGLAFSFSILGVAVFLSRVDPENFLSAGSYLSKAICATAMLAAVIGASSWQMIRHKSYPQQVIVAGLGSPLLITILLPKPAALDGGYKTLIDASPNLHLLILGLIAVIYAALLSMFLSKNSKSYITWLQRLAPLGLVGPILLIKYVDLGIPILSPDDYHFGEFSVPGLLLSEGRFDLYAGYDPARGFVNYLPGLFSKTFFDGTFASYNYSFWLIYAVVLCVAIPVFSKFLPAWAVGIAFSLFPVANGLFEIDILSTTFVLITALLLDRNQRTKALLFSAVAGPALFLFAPGQATITFLACIPVWIYALFRQRISKFEFSKFVGLITIFIGLYWLMGLGSSFYGAFQYGFEQSAANTESYGVPWLLSLGISPINPAIYEVIRTAWIFLPIACFFMVPRAIADREFRSRFVAIAVPFGIISCLLISRAAGRIDPMSPSRLGNATMWAIVLALPLILFFVFGIRATPVAVLGLVIPLGLISSIFGASILFSNVGDRILGSIEPISISKSQYEQLSKTESEFPNIGMASVDESQMKRINEVKRVLDATETRDETYLDLTNRSAIYSYVEKVPPIASGAVFNLSTVGQQNRATSSLARNRPPIILVSADNILHDGGPVSIRNPLLYRDTLINLEKFELMKGQTTIWLVKKNRAKLAVDKGDLKVVPKKEFAGTLSRIWGISDLQRLPVSWGSSWESLKSNLSRSNFEDKIPFRQIGGDVFLSLNGLDATISQNKLSILVFDFKCDTGNPISHASIAWQSEEGKIERLRMQVSNSTLAIPMFSSTDWTLRSKSPAEIRFNLDSNEECSSFTIENPRLASVN